MAKRELELLGRVLEVRDDDDIDIVLASEAARYEISIADSSLIDDPPVDGFAAGGDARLEVFADGTLVLSGERLHLRAGPLEAVEAWEIRGSDGLLAIAVPTGGGVAIFEPGAASFSIADDATPMPALTGPDRQRWDAPREEFDELISSAVRAARDDRTRRSLSEASGPWGLTLGVDEASFAVAAALRTAIAWMCEPILREHPRQRARLATRDRLHALDAILTRVLTPARRHAVPTFPNRRHVEQFDGEGLSIAHAAAIFGLTHDEANRQLREHGFRQVRAWGYANAMDLAPRDLDVTVDHHERVTSIHGLHM